MRKSKDTIKCLQIKFVIFFNFSFFLVLLFWYFILFFGAVYKNTQIILIKDSLFSFLLSIIYPFGLNFLPGFFRIYALREPKRKKNVYINLVILSH